MNIVWFVESKILLKRIFFCRFDLGPPLLKICVWPPGLRLKVLKSLSVLEKSFNECLRYIVLTSHMAILLSCHIQAAYGILRLFNFSSILVYLVWPLIFLIATIFESVGYTISSKLYETSKLQILTAKGIGSSSDRRYLEKQFRCIRPVRIDIGHFFPLSKSTLFNFWLAVMENTTTILFI